jgi:hypothetical protein
MAIVPAIWRLRWEGVQGQPGQQREREGERENPRNNDKIESLLEGKK